MKTGKLKLSALLMALLLLVSVAGCGSENTGSSSGSGSSAASGNVSTESGGTEDGKEVTLTFMTCVSSTTNDTIKPIVEKYEAQGVTIDYQSVAGSTADYQQKLTTLFAAETYPDILFIPTIWSKMHGALGIAQSLEGYVSQEVLDDFNAGPLETCMYEGELIGLPMSSDCITLFYNKGMIEAAGITNIPDSHGGAWTWEEFEEAGKTAKEANGTMHGMVFGADFSIELPFFWQAGATVLSPELDKVTLNQQGTIDTLNWLRSLVEKELTSSNIFLGVDDAEAMFVSQQSPFYVANCGATSSLLNAIEGNFEMGVTYLPRNKESANKIGGWNMEITNKTENLPEAVAFLEYMVSAEAMNAYCTATGAMPTRGEAAQTISFGELDPFAPLFIDEIANIPEFAITDSVNSQYQTYKGIMAQEFQNFIANPGQTAEETAKIMEDAIKQALEL